MSKKEIDFDEEIKRIARKSNINMRKTEYSFDKRLKKLDLEMDTVLNDKIKEFDDSKKLTEEYLQFEKDTSVVDRYREKLKKI